MLFYSLYIMWNKSSCDALQLLKKLLHINKHLSLYLLTTTWECACFKYNLVIVFLSFLSQSRVLHRMWNTLVTDSLLCSPGMHQSLPPGTPSIMYWRQDVLSFAAPLESPATWSTSILTPLKWQPATQRERASQPEILQVIYKCVYRHTGWKHLHC